MPDECKHPIVQRFSDMTSTADVARHPPTSSKITYTREPRTAEQLAAWKPSGFVSTTFAAYPILLNRYLVAKLRCAVSRTLVVPKPIENRCPLEVAQSNMKRARYCFPEKITWLELVRGKVTLTEKEPADHKANRRAA